MSQSTSVRRDEATDELTWTTDDMREAKKSGWAVIYNERRGFHIGRAISRTGSPCFKSHKGTDRYVRYRADQGSALAKKAIAYIVLRRLT